jgi:hypothetical protein
VIKNRKIDTATLMLVRNETDHAAGEETAFQVLEPATRFQHGFDVLQRQSASA